VGCGHREAGHDNQRRGEQRDGNGDVQSIAPYAEKRAGERIAIRAVTLNALEQPFDLPRGRVVRQRLVAQGFAIAVEIGKALGIHDRSPLALCERAGGCLL
jgi:hypothetical protein